MRRSFPWFWLFQFFALALLGLLSLFYPAGLLKFFRGYSLPKQVERPANALNNWVLGIQEIPPPNERVKEFFANHDEALHAHLRLWTPNDPSLRKHTEIVKRPGWRDPETRNAAWEETEVWLLSSRPAPPPEDYVAIRDWLRALDQMPQPSDELRDWIVNLRTPQLPPKELRVLILEADQVLPDSWRLAAQQVRLASPCILAAAFFTLLGLVTPLIRRPLARVFVLICMFWTLAQFDNTFAPHDWDISESVAVFGLGLGVIIVARMLRAVPGLTAGSTLFVIISLWWVAVIWAAYAAEVADPTHLRARVNLTIASATTAIVGITNAWYWLIGRSEDPPQDNGGIVQRRPPQLWTLWVAQFLILFFTGMMALVFPQELAELFIRERFDHLTIDVVDDSVKSLGAWTISMALFSFFALSVGRDWVWQGISIVFCLVFGLLALSTVHVASTGEYSLWIYAFGFQGIVFIPITMILLRRRDPYSNANVERIQPEDWSLTDLLIAPFLAGRPLLNGQRPFYRQGVGAKGFMRVLSMARSGEEGSLALPRNDFFQPGKQLPIRLRFANFSQADDASLDIRGCAVQIGGGGSERLDLLFATGEFSPFATLIDYQRFLCTLNPRKLILTDQAAREGLAAGMRRAPFSFANLSYYHQFILEWATPEAETYLVRFRLVPRPDHDVEARQFSETERGIPSDDDLAALWKQERRDDEARDVNYLRKELVARLSDNRPVAFQLEAQFHKPQPNDTLDWYDATIEWESRESPWLPLAEIVLESALAEHECERLAFDPSRLPLSLTVPRPDRLTDLNDPRALASARFRIVRFIARLRDWRCRLKSPFATRKARATVSPAT